jgi:glycogen debranching enzyme
MNSTLLPVPAPRTREWLEADGLGGFASGTVSGIRTRRYHSLLLVAATPPTGRMVLVNGLDAWVETPGGKFDLSSQCYAPGVVGGDGAYHQGTVWPWLLGPFVESWVRVRGGTNSAKRDARRRFLAPLLAHLEEAGLGHISEIADAEAPHTPRGCPFQAWSVGEALRLDRVILAETAAPHRSKPRANRRQGPTVPARTGWALSPLRSANRQGPSSSHDPGAQGTPFPTVQPGAT